MKKLEKLVETVGRKTDNGIIMGLLPRLQVSPYALSKAIGVNNRLKSLCAENNMTFVDLWDKFSGYNEYFQRDGTHFNNKGMKLFGHLINSNLYRRNNQDQVDEIVGTQDLPQSAETEICRTQGNVEGHGGQNRV